MTVASEIRKSESYVGNGIATEFVFPFKVFLASDVQVVVADELGSESVLELDSAYGVELNENQNTDPGGTVILFDPLADGHTLVITSDIAELQPVDLANQGGFYPSVVTTALDRLTILVQQLRERLSRAAVLPITSDADADTLVSSILVISGIQDELAEISNNLPAIAAAGAAADDIQAILPHVAAIENLAPAVAGIDALAPVAEELGDIAANLVQILAAEQAAEDAEVARAAAVVAQGAAEAAAASVDPSTFVSKAAGVAEIPTWTTAGRPASPPAGVGINTDTNQLEWRSGGQWRGFEAGGNSAFVPTMSGSSVELTGLPAGINELTLYLDNAGTNGGNDVLCQIGTAGGLVTSGYAGSRVDGTNTATSGSGLPMRHATSGNQLLGFIKIARRPGTNIWVMTAVMRRVDTGATNLASARVDIAGELTRVALLGNGSNFNGGGFWAAWR